ncbi:MAG: SDR family oxidoreductase [Pseudomonadota bacterium]
MSTSNQGRLADKKAVITGGTTGIGFETARQYLGQGAKVIITGRNQARLDEAVAKLGEGAVGLKADVAHLDELATLATETKNVFGSIDILFANAGIGVFGAVENITEASYDEQFDINVKGVFFTVQQLAPLLHDGGSIILNASAVNAKGVPTGSVYFATKAAIRSFARSFAAEFGPRHVRVNSLSPGIVRTSFQSSSNVGEEGSEGFVQMVVNTAPLRREGTPLDMANAAVFLGSDESTYISGTDLTVDGGWMNV